MKTVCRLATACLLILALSPRHVLAGGDMGLGPFDIGEKYFARKDFGRARTYFRKALEQNDVRAHYRLGLIDEEAGRNRDALGHYRQFVEEGQPGAWHGDAVLRVAAAEARLEKTATSPPAGLLEQGKSLFKKGKFSEAEQALLRAAAEDESQPEVHFFLGEVYLALERFDEAEAEYKKAKGFY